MNELKLIMQADSQNGVLSFEKKQLHDLTKLEVEFKFDTTHESDTELPASLSIKNVDPNDKEYNGLEMVFVLDTKDLTDIKTFVETALKATVR